jgi:glycosyltransferase involved in cell wall biosynthesis
MSGSAPKILYLHNAGIGSRAANLVQVVSMCSAFAQAGYRTVLVLHAERSDEVSHLKMLRERYDCDERVVLRIVRRQMPGRLFRHVNHLWYRRIVKEEKPDLCFVRDPRYFSMTLRMGILTLLELHNTRLHLGSSLLDRLFRMKVVKGATHPLCLGVITISKALNAFWEAAGIPAERTLVLHDGVNPEMFSTTIDQASAREALGLPSDRKIVVYTGNLQANRGIRYILDLARHFPDLLFVMAGGEPAHVDFYRQESEREQISNIRFDGHQPHLTIPVYLRAADILLAMWSAEVPTIRYCSPLKVFEYMASGRPALFPGYPTIMEVAEDGKEAFIASPDNPEAFRATLQKILDADPDKIMKITNNAREKVASQYTWQQRVQTIIEHMPPKLHPQMKNDG